MECACKYNRSFGLHDMGANAAFRYTAEEATGSSQDLKEGNFTFRANYAYNKRYMLEATLAAMGSNRFQGDNKYFFAHSVGGAWIISNESFLRI